MRLKPFCQPALIVLCLLAAPLASSPVWAQEDALDTAVGKDAKAAPDAKKESEFVRVVRNDNDQLESLQTAIATYTGTIDGKTVVVELVGAIHVGDKKYYDELNKLFVDYESVLYELVAPEGTVIPKGGRVSESTHPIALLQGGMKGLLELEHQLECVDYTKPNFVHADMSPEQFSESMKNRGESFLQMFFKMMGQSVAIQSKKPGQSSDVELLFALFSNDRAYRLKQIMAGQFGDINGAMSVLSGPDGSAIITERNKKAFEVLRSQLGEGKRKVAVFYGAGHLVDMEKRLINDFGLKRTGVRWLTAWDLRKKKK